MSDGNSAANDAQERRGGDLLNLFAPPPPPVAGETVPPLSKADLTRNKTVSSSNRSSVSEESFGALPGSSERTPLLGSNDGQSKSSGVGSLQLDSDYITPKTGNTARKSPISHKAILEPDLRSRNNSKLPSIREIGIIGEEKKNGPPGAAISNTFSSLLYKCKQGCSSMGNECTKTSTWIGGVMFLLYHIVFCLTMGSAIRRPLATKSLLGVVTKMTALGVMFGAPVQWIGLGEIPALYPTVDLFVAPFLAQMAIQIDQVIHNDESLAGDNDDVFLATFSFLTALSLVLSGFLLILSSVFKLANLGSFLPYPVLCGFFAACGVMMWNLAFTIDTNGMSFHQVFFSGDWLTIRKALVHHVPSLVAASGMKYLGPKHPFYVMGVVVATVTFVYTIMLVLGIRRDEMIEDDWFWSSKQLVYDDTMAIGFAKCAPPAPLGWICSMFEGKVHWAAVTQALDSVLALSCLYLIRCSLHGAALKKNPQNLVRVEPVPVASPVISRGRPHHRRKFSEVLDLENFGWVPDAHGRGAEDTNFVSAKPASIPLQSILARYGYSQFACALAGGTGIVPSVAASSTMYSLRAEGLAPQILSVILLGLFYVTDFALVGLIPKPAFSALLVLAFLDLEATWVVKSFEKTKDKIEWMVVPVIVFFTFFVGMLWAVFLGIAMSSFFFVGSFHRSGVVKYLASGISIRSTVERSINMSRWLDSKGELIQVIVLQNYLFFANASSILTYISSMFDDVEDETDEVLVVPVPSVVVLDLTLVTGIDTSAADVFRDILNMAVKHNCRLFVSGLSNDLRQVLSLVGFKPDSGKERKRRKLRFFSILDVAVGKAEDLLLDEAGIDEQEGPPGLSGFDLALYLVDEQHQTKFSEDLASLKKYTSIVDVEPGQILYETDSSMDRGLFFIERGVMKIERNSCFTLSRTGGGDDMLHSNATIGQLNARSGSIGREIARLKAASFDSRCQTFREARIGPGWVLGSVEALCGLVHPGSIVAVTPCRLHHISYRTIKEVELENPLLVLQLHKLLAYLMAKRQSVTINQLATLHSIMGSPPHKKPLTRSWRS